MEYLPTTELRIVNRDADGIPEGTRVQTAYRPEYGDTLRVVSWRLPGARLYTDLKSVRFIARADTCSPDCGHLRPGGEMEC